MAPETAVLLSAHGTVEDVADIPAFVAKIRRGRPTPDHIVEEVRRRFLEIGGSPLLKTTRELAAALEARLGLPVLVGMRLWKPSIEQALDDAEARGIKRIVSLPLAPQSVHVYHEAVREAARGRFEIIEVPAWGDEPLLLRAFSESIDEGLARFAPPARQQVALVLSAHSLPRRVIAAGDPYETQFGALCAALVAARGEAGRVVKVAFQSQGMDGGDWLGPDLLGTFRELESEGRRDVLIAAVGFLGDHTETLYDLDIEARQQAEQLGLRLERAPSLNLRPRLQEALEAVTRRALAPTAAGAAS